MTDAGSVDFVIITAEFSGPSFDHVCEFRAREAFRRREGAAVPLPPGLLLDEEEFRVQGAVLNHGIPRLAFAFEEKLRANVWREGLTRIGPWLREAKRVVRQGAPDTSQVCVRDGLAISLGDLKQHALRTARGKKSLTQSISLMMGKILKESSHWRGMPISSSSRHRFLTLTPISPPKDGI
jgi:ribonuclease Z